MRFHQTQRDEQYKDDESANENIGNLCVWNYNPRKCMDGSDILTYSACKVLRRGSTSSQTFSKICTLGPCYRDTGRVIYTQGWVLWYGS